MSNPLTDSCSDWPIRLDCGPFTGANQPPCPQCIPYIARITCDPPSIVITPAYYNTQQSYTNTCPSGTTGAPITVTIPAGTVLSGISVADANATALAMATAQANALRVLTPCVPSGEIIFIITENDDFIITEDGIFIIT